MPLLARRLAGLLSAANCAFAGAASAPSNPVTT